MRLDDCRLNQRYLSNSTEAVSPTGTTTGIDDYPHEARQRRAPVDHASQLGAISDVTDEEER